MKTFIDYATEQPTTIIQELNSSVSHGLSKKQVQEHLQQFGPNAISKKRSAIFDILQRQCKDPFLYLLIFTSLLSFALQEYLNGSMIAFLAFISVGLSVYQEYFAEKTVMLLNKLVSFHVKVLRDNHHIDITSEELVPGDIILVKAGSLLSADMRFLQAENLVIDESMLTGESNPLQKQAQTLPTQPSLFEATNIGFAGTTVTSGKGIGIVFATGDKTTIGTIAQTPTTPIRKNAFSQGIERLTFFILIFVGSTISLVFCINAFYKGTTNIWQLLIFSISLAVTIIPEALNVVISFALSLGARLLAKKKVIVKRLSSIDDLGSIEVLCIDKTGTITTNELSVAAIMSHNKTSEKIIAQYATLCTTTMENNGPSHEPFDHALESYCITNNIGYKNDFRLVAHIPFDPSRRRVASILQGHNTLFLSIRGAYEEVITRCNNISEADKTTFTQWMDQHEQQGCRILAVAQKKLEPSTHDIPVDEQGLDLLGLIAFSDTLKETAIASIKRAQKAGIAVKILSGDSAHVTHAVAKQVGLISHHDEVIIGSTFEALSPEEKKVAVNRCAVFARVTPEQKCVIVKLLQEQCDVGFLGEGINDAKVLKAATVGIAVNNATDVAKEAADIIILENNLGIIIDGIMIGRRVFTNTLKYLLLTLASNFSNFYTLLIASLIMKHLPMLPLQLLFVNLLSDIPMMFVATDQVDIVELRLPKNYQFKKLIHTSIILGVICTLFDFIFLATFFHAPPAVMQTNWFIFSIITEFALFCCLRTRYPLFKTSSPSIILASILLFSSIISFILPYTAFGQNVLSFVPPTAIQLLTICTITLMTVVAIELVKMLLLRFHNNNHEQNH